MSDYCTIVLPTQPVVLSVEQIGELNRKLTDLRHDMNNSLSLIAATAELIRRHPTSGDRMWDTLLEQPRKVTDTVTQFSRDIEAVLHIIRT